MGLLHAVLLLLQWRVFGPTVQAPMPFVVFVDDDAADDIVVVVVVVVVAAVASCDVGSPATSSKPFSC